MGTLMARLCRNYDRYLPLRIYGSAFIRFHLNDSGHTNYSRGFVANYRITGKYRKLNCQLHKILMVSCDSLHYITIDVSKCSMVVVFWHHKHMVSLGNYTQLISYCRVTN